MAKVMAGKRRPRENLQRVAYEANLPREEVEEFDPASHIPLKIEAYIRWKRESSRHIVLHKLSASRNFVISSISMDIILSVPFQKIVSTLQAIPTRPQTEDIYSSSWTE